MSYDFFYLHKSLSINDLRAQGGHARNSLSINDLQRFFLLEIKPRPHTTRDEAMHYYYEKTVRC